MTEETGKTMSKIDIWLHVENPFTFVEKYHESKNIVEKNTITGSLGTLVVNI